MKVLCPGCETELDPSNTHCPVCLRQRSRKEIMDSLRQGKTGGGGSRWLLWLLLLALGGGLHYYNGRLKKEKAARAAALKQTQANIAAKMEAQQQQQAETVFRSPDGQRPTVAVLGQIAPATPASPAPPASSSPASAPPSPEPGRETAPREEAPAEEPRRASNRWSVRGQVYDLLSLKPVPGAKLVFQDRSSGKAYGAVTDARGRYAAKLPKVRDGGYELTISHPRYRGDYLEEMSPAFRNQGLERRREAAEQASASEVLHVPLLPEHEHDEVAYDLVLFSRR